MLRNAQALCADCNLAKSNQMDLARYFADATPRRWQSEFLQAFVDKAPAMATNPDEGFLLYATPGAGKTVAMFAAANWLRQAGLTEWVVIVVPAAPLCDQVAKEAKRLFKMDLRSGSDGADSQFHGEVVTIQSLRNRDDSSVRRRKGNVLLCVDEFHHPSATNSWGEDIERSLGGCRFKLFCTGTPFRSDRSALKFVKYHELEDGEVELQPDYPYAYRDALADSKGAPSENRVVRTVQFHLYDASPEEPIEWAMDGERYAHRLGDNLAAEYEEEESDRLSQFVKKLRSYRFDAATEPKFKLARTMLRDAVDRLDLIRQTHGHAGGLVVCKRKEHADQVAQYMRKELGVDPIVVYQDADGGTSSSKIKDFRRHDSPHKWIVAVQQVSEGVDIKRLRVCVWLTNKRTHLLFLQILGRIIRWEHTAIGERVITPALDQMAHMFMPAQGSDTPDRDDPIELVKFAKEIEEDMRLVMEVKRSRKCDLCGDDPASFGCGNCVNTPECPLFRRETGPPMPERELLGAGGEIADALLRGEFWNPETLNALGEEASALGIPVDAYIAFLKMTTPERFAKSKAIAEKAADVQAESVATRTGHSTEEVEEMTISEQLDILKKEASSLVSRLGMAIARAQGWPDDDSRRQNIFMRIHKRWTRVGGKKHESTTVGDLTAKVDWLKGQLVKVTANDIDEDLIND